jgi:hypothetical protein
MQAVMLGRLDWLAVKAVHVRLQFHHRGLPSGAVPIYRFVVIHERLAAKRQTNAQLARRLSTKAGLLLTTR